MHRYLLLAFSALLIGAYSKELFIRTKSYGTNTGTSWDNAWGPSMIGDAVKTANSSDIIYIRADEGNYTATSTINLYGGGSVGKRVRMQGADVNLKPRMAVFVGSRKPFVAPSDPETVTNVTGYGGGKFLDVRGSSIGIAWMKFIDIGFVLAFGTDNVTDVLIENCEVINVRSFIDGDGSVNNITIRNITGFGYSKKFIRFQSYSHDIAVIDVVADSARQAYDDFSGGLVLDGNAYNIVARGCWFLNGEDTQDDSPTKYWNADGFSSERGNHDILIENCMASGWTDGGHDHKSENITLRNCTAWDNKRNYRLWGYSTIAYNLISIQPRNRGGIGGQSHVYLNDNGLATVYGGEFRHNDSRTRSLYIETGSVLTLIGVKEIYTGNSTANGNPYIAGTGKVVRLNATTSSSASSSGGTSQNSSNSASTSTRASTTTTTRATNSSQPTSSTSTTSGLVTSQTLLATEAISSAVRSTYPTFICCALLILVK